MYRVLLVDDEYEVRSGLKIKIDWESLGFSVAGEAGDGREALALLEREPFDLIVTDIRMPIMSGLELLKQCAENRPDVRFVVLSGHDDFHYVKAAMQHGARDYLLKPVVRSELIHLLGKLRDELDRKRTTESSRLRLQHQLLLSRSALQDQLMLEWVSNEEEGREDSLLEEARRLGMDGVFAEGRRLRFVCSEYRIPEGRLGERADGNGLFRLAFELVCRETAAEAAWSPQVFPFRHRGYPQMMFFLIASSSADPEKDTLADALCLRLQSNIRHFLKAEGVFGIGVCVGGVRDIRKSFLSSLLAWSRSQSGVSSQIVRPDDAADALMKLFPEIEKRMTLAVENGDLAGFESMAEAVVQSGRNQVQAVAAFILRVVLLLDHLAGKHHLAVPDTRQWMFPDEIWRRRTEASAIPYLSGIAAQVAEGIKSSRVSGGIEAVEAIRKHIDGSYMNELSLTMLAERFHINATYLSELFKKQTGTTFVDYVAQVRIGKAAELLRDPQLRLSDIAELVGFANASYLSSVFKKHYGISPNEFRAQASSFRS
ncbi:response regulator [Cohnella sp. GCM10027633]|uniref:response regulator n=1 Tax=unclassified Cohnella TaxID=2636738 RepID=UPI003636D071